MVTHAGAVSVISLQLTRTLHSGPIHIEVHIEVADDLVDDVKIALLACQDGFQFRISDAS